MEDWKKKEPYTIIIGGDMDKDARDVFEGKNLNQPKNVLYVDTLEEAMDYLSPKKIGLLKSLMDYEPSPCELTISELAKATGRLQPAVSRDIKDLREKGFVETRKDKQSTRITPIHNEIIIRIKNAQKLYQKTK